jgi:hypothetical protein
MRFGPAKAADAALSPMRFRLIQMFRRTLLPNASLRGPEGIIVGLVEQIG